MPTGSILRNREAVTEAVRRSQSIAGALRLLGLRPAGGNYRALHQACERFGLEVPGKPRTGSRMPESNGPPSPYKGAALPDELMRHADPASTRDLFLPMAAALIIAGLAAGCALALAIRSRSGPELAIAVAACAVVALAAMAGHVSEAGLEPARPFRGTSTSS
jgi:hypothetical protein